MKPNRILSFAWGCVSLAVGLSGGVFSVQGARASASSGGIFSVPYDMDPGSRSWVSSMPTPGDMISWSSGPNSADGGVSPVWPYGPEPYFAFPSGAPVPRVFAGFGPVSWYGILDSVSTTAGAGCSGVATMIAGGTTISYNVASYAVFATGKLGNKSAPGVPLEWRSKAAAKDPWALDMLWEPPAPLIDLMTMAEFEGAMGTENGELDFDAYCEYLDPDGNPVRLDFLQISADNSGLKIESDAPPNLEFWTIDSVSGGGSLTLTDLPTIKSALEADWADNKTLDHPLSLAFVLNDIAAPTLDMGDGTVLKYHCDIEARDGAAPDGTSTLPALLLALGGLGLASRRRRLLGRKVE